MNLKETAREGLAEMKQAGKKLNLDTFGEIMDKFIRESAFGVLAYKDEGEEEFHVKGAGCGAVMDFYIFLNALPALYREMLEEMGGKASSKWLSRIAFGRIRSMTSAASCGRRLLP